MRFPPNEWSIRLEEPESTAGDSSTSKLSAEVPIQVDNVARINGCFKVILSGLTHSSWSCPPRTCSSWAARPPVASRWR